MNRDCKNIDPPRHAFFVPQVPRVVSSKPLRNFRIGGILLLDDHRFNCVKIPYGKVNDLFTFLANEIPVYPSNQYRHIIETILVNIESFL